MRGNYVRPQQTKAFSDFANLITSSFDLKVVDKIAILEYMAERYCNNDNNLLYLEYKQTIKELHASNNSNH